MKRIICFIFLLTVLLSSAAQPAMGAQAALVISFTETAAIKAGQEAAVLKTKINATKSGTVVYSLTDTARKTVVYTETKTGVKAGDTLTWKAPYDDTGLKNSKPIKRMRASFVMDEKTYTFNLFYTYSAKKNEAPVITIEKATWYPNNTACAFGPQFRNVRPALTDKWYMFSPIDLSIQGRQEFEYVASNLYIIGRVYVDVAGDSVTVTYQNFYDDQGGNTQTLSEYFTFFHDLAGVTNVEPETMEDRGYSFGQKVSIRDDLEGDTHVLLFVRNRVTYSDYVTNQQKLVRFWPNIPERVALREAMMKLTD